MRFFRFSLILVLGFFLSAFIATRSFAQAESTTTIPTAAPQEELEAPDDSGYRSSTGSYSMYTDYMSGDMNENQQGDGYFKPTYERLSQLYWALAMLDLEDNEAIDGYLMLNECDLYKQFYSRDFELNELRRVTRDSIVHNISKFPTKFEVFMPVGLDRYDIATKRFKISKSSQFSNSKRLEVSRNTYYRRVCNRDDIPKYPRNFILVFNRPFTLTEVPMAPDLAQKIIDFSDVEQKKGSQGKNFQFRALSPFSRVIFLRLKVNISQFKEMGKNYSDSVVPVFFATIDGYQLYEDLERKLLIYDQEVEAKVKFDRLKKAGGGKNIQIPDGPLMQESVKVP